MSEIMVERVARAIQDAAINNMIGSLNKADAETYARAAIEVMRESTDDVAEIKNSNASSGVVNW